MSSKIVKKNFFGESNAPLQFLGASNLYDLRWNPKNGDIELVQTGPVLDFSPIILFKNDTWDATHVANATAGSGPIDYIPDTLANDINRKAFSLEIANFILNAQEKNGGGVIPEWIKEINNVETDAEKNLILDKFIAGTLNKEIKVDNIDKNLTPALSHANFKKTDITLNTIKELMLDGPLKYPVDAIYSNRKTGYNQDHVRITQYTYQPPRAQMVSSSASKKIDTEKDEKNTYQKFENQSAYEIFSEGFQRLSPLEKYLGMVRLPMPTDISDSNNVAWGQDQVNNLSAAMTSAVGGNLMGTAASALITGGIGAFLGAAEEGASLGVLMGALANSGIDVGNIGQGQSGALARSTLQSRLLAMAGVQVSPEALMARGLGVIPNSNMELLFQAPALREFAFSWKMTPRDEYEAKKVRHIIRFFKQGMAARKMGEAGTTAGTKSLFLGTPNVFHVQYKTNRDEDIEGVNRIKTCAVTGCAVNYTPDGVWSAYEEGQPVSTVMSLRMQELEPVYDTDYQGDIAEGRKFREIPGSPGSKASGDLYKISLDEVGY